MGKYNLICNFTMNVTFLFQKVHITVMLVLITFNGSFKTILVISIWLSQTTLKKADHVGVPTISRFVLR